MRTTPPTTAAQSASGWGGGPGGARGGVGGVGGRAARPCILGGLECYSCQAGAITINKLLEALGAPITLR